MATVATASVTIESKPNDSIVFNSHPGLLEVKLGESAEDYSSKLVTLKPFKRGDMICKLDNYTLVNAPRYTTVQVGVNTHVELHSDLVYMNHSCSPSIRLDTSQMKIFAEKDLKPGDEITFFYPSTEFKMARPFYCWCGAKECIRIVAGAYHIPIANLSNYYINKHIRESIMKALSEQDSDFD
jgi:hypothetical protein